MKKAHVEIESSYNVKRDDHGNAVEDGERYTLFCKLGGKIFRTMTFYGNRDAQNRALAECQDDIKTKVEIEK